MINFRNPEGWERYKTVSEEHAQEIKDLVDNIEDINELRIWIHIVNMDIQIESFGISWEGPSKQKKITNWDSKEIYELVLEQQEELDDLIEEGASVKDLKTKIYKLNQNTIIVTESHKATIYIVTDDSINNSIILNIYILLKVWIV